LNHKSR